MMCEADSKRRLLWVDDDPVDRFAYEKEVLEESDDWAITWAATIRDAADSLSSKEFDVILLDQMLPWGSSLNTPDVWSGCKLLYWLRGTRFSAGTCPWRLRDSTQKLVEELGVPHTDNRDIHVIVLSAYADEEIVAAMRRASLSDKHLLMLSKPVDVSELRMRLKAGKQDGGPRK